MSNGGKGSKQRPTDPKKYDEGYDRIFGKKDKLILPMPGTIGSAKIVFGEQTKEKEGEK
jgi:hypothetical protein